MKMKPTINAIIFCWRWVVITAFFLTVLLNSFNANAQVGYTYDKAGNRVSCYILKVSSAFGDLEEELIEHPLANREIRLYPNPTKGQLIIEITNGDDKENYTIRLFNMSGQQILEKQRTGNGSFEFNIEDQASGTYILILQSADGSTHYKIIKT